MRQICKLISGLYIVAVLLAITGCTGKPSNNSSTTSRTDNSVANNNETTQNPSTDEKGRILVVYFSCTGATKTVAEYAADILNAEIYEIKPENPYTEEDLAYYTNGRADKEQNDPNARPDILGGVENIIQYDTILIGYPIWHGEAPRIISTFLENYDFSGKTILPFCTSHSSGIGSSDTNLHSLAENAKWLEGRGHTTELLGDEVISSIAKAHKVSSAQVILRWNLQKGVVVIPGSSNFNHIKENTELYHFELTEEEMNKINVLD